MGAEEERRPYPTAGATLRRDEPHERRRDVRRVPMEHPEDVPARFREVRAGPVRDGTKNRPANDPRGRRFRISRPEIVSHERESDGRAHKAPPADRAPGRERSKDVARAPRGRHAEEAERRSGAWAMRTTRPGASGEQVIPQGRRGARHVGVAGRGTPERDGPEPWQARAAAAEPANAEGNRTSREATRGRSNPRAGDRGDPPRRHRPLTGSGAGAGEARPGADGGPGGSGAGANVRPPGTSRRPDATHRGKTSVEGASPGEWAAKNHRGGGPSRTGPHRPGVNWPCRHQGGDRRSAQGMPPPVTGRASA